MSVLVMISETDCCCKVRLQAYLSLEDSRASGIMVNSYIFMTYLLVGVRRNDVTTRTIQRTLRRGSELSFAGVAYGLK